MITQNMGEIEFVEDSSRVSMHVNFLSGGANLNGNFARNQPVEDQFAFTPNVNDYFEEI